MRRDDHLDTRSTGIGDWATLTSYPAAFQKNETGAARDVKRPHSTIATFMPGPASRRARAGPGCPVPMMFAS